MVRRTPHIHERFLRHIWNKQYLRTAALRTTNGSPLSVLHPGTINEEGGPDFCSARIRIGTTSYVGDVEIHRNVAEWLQHHHQIDPHYNKVVLHVVLEGDVEHFPTIVESGRSIPILLLEPFLSESIRTIWHRSILDEKSHKEQALPCYRRNKDVPADLILRWLRRLSVERIELKLRRFEERLRQLAYEELMSVKDFFQRYRFEGSPEDIPPPLPDLSAHDLSKKHLWEQVLYEGMMEGLGYARNRDAFVRLAQSASLRRIRDSMPNPERLPTEALVFGVAGLLPTLKSLEERESRDYVRGLNRHWAAIKKHYRGERLHEGDWHFFPARPTNFPTLRIAVAASIIQKLLAEDFFRMVIQAFKQPSSSRETLRRLNQLFEINVNEFWQFHYSFDVRSEKPHAGLGSSRMNDIVINTIVPLALLYARTFKDTAVRTRAMDLYSSFPPLSDNSVTRLMERQLLRGKIELSSVGLQQGTIQLYKYYCTE